MFGRLVLAALQFVAGWAATPALEKYVSVGGNPQVFIKGAIAAVVVWMVGLIGAQALKDVSTPSTTTLTWALAGGLIGAALLVFKVPQMFQIAMPPLALILLLTLLGYHLKR